MGVPQMYRCPNCRSDGSSIGMFASYFYVFECSDCGERFCHNCPASSNGHRCAHCGRDGHFEKVGQVYKG